jgi:hypothetical protein
MGQTARISPERAQRFSMAVPIHFRKRGMDHWVRGKTVNISRTGILFSTEEAISPHSILDIRVDFPGAAAMTCQCTVIRTNPSEVAVHLHHPNLSPQG